MKFNININQKGLENDNDITLVEASVIDWIYTFCGTNNRKINSQKVDGWTWINCSYLIQDMPLLRIKSRSGCSKLLTRLENLGYIEIKREPRKLFIKTTDKMDNLYVSCGKQVVDLTEEVVSAGTQSCIPQDTNHNTNTIILNNNTNIHSDKSEQTKIRTDGQLPEKSRGKSYILRVKSVYCDLFKNKYGFYPEINMGRFGKALKSLMETKTELQISAMLISFFDWAGMTGDDNFTRQKLIDATHNFSWFFSTVNQYEVYIRNVYGLDFDNEDAVREFVKKNLLAINN
jgi:hypothetical protein